jgi:hypothetical protein
MKISTADVLQFLQLFCPLQSKLRTRLGNDRAHTPFYISIHFFHGHSLPVSQKQPTKGWVFFFCFQIFAKLLVPYLLLYTLVGYPCGAKEDNGIGGWYYHIRLNEKLESSPSGVRLHVVNRGKTQWTHRPF